MMWIVLVIYWVSLGAKKKSWVQVFRIILLTIYNRQNGALGGKLLGAGGGGFF